MANANLVKFYSTTQDKYDALESKDATALYFVTDTGRVYKGDDNVTTDVFLVETLPDSIKDGQIVIYKHEIDDTQVYSVWTGDNGTNVEIVPSISRSKEAFVENSVYAGFVPTVGSVYEWVKTYVSGKVSDFAGDVAGAFSAASFNEGKITFTDVNSGTHDVNLGKIAHNVEYDAETMTLTIPVYGEENDVVVNIPKDQFVHSARFEAEYGDDKIPAIVLVVRTDDEDDAGTEIAIPAADLIDEYTVSSTDTISMSMTNNEITSELKIQTAAEGDEGVLLAYVETTVEDEDGESTTTKKVVKTVTIASIMEDVDSKISDAAEDLESKIKDSMLGDGAENDIITSTANGVQRSGKKIGGAALAETPDASTVATEAAVSAAISSAVTNAEVVWNELD